MSKLDHGVPRLNSNGTGQPHSTEADFQLHRRSKVTDMSLQWGAKKNVVSIGLQGRTSVAIVLLPTPQFSQDIVTDTMSLVGSSMNCLITKGK